MLASNTVSTAWPRDYAEAVVQQSMKRPFASFGGWGNAAAKAEPVAPALTVQQLITELRDGGMPVSAIAEANNVERRTIYAWMEGKDVRGANSQRAVFVHSLMTGVAGVDVRGVYRFWNTPIGGQVLRDLLSQPIIDQALVKSTLEALGPAALKLASSTVKMASKNAGNPVLDDVPQAGITF